MSPASFREDEAVLTTHSCTDELHCIAALDGCFTFCGIGSDWPIC